MSDSVGAVTEEDRGSERYTRLRQLGWDVDLLRDSVVLVVGAGALGNEIIKNLALAGVGNVVIVDPDSIETHNLTRSVLFRPGDIGRSKASVAAEMAREIEPRLKTRAFVAPVQSALGLGVFRRVDVVLGGVDNLQTRRDLNRACMLADTAFIDGGLFYLDGDVRTFLPPFPVCFDCTLTQEERDEEWRRWSCLNLSDGADTGGGPTAPTVSAMVGGLQAQLALKHIHRHKESPYKMVVPNGVRIRFNGFADEYERWSLGRDAECPTHLTTTAIPSSAVRSVPYGRDTTAETLISLVQEELGPDSYIELGFDLIHTLSCLSCGHCDAPMRRQGSLSAAEALCPRCTPSACRSCGSSVAETIASRPDLVFPDRVDCAVCFQSNPVVMRDSQTVNRIEPDSPVLNYTLAQLDVPLLDILEAKSFEADGSIFLQLDGDVLFGEN